VKAITADGRSSAAPRDLLRIVLDGLDADKAIDVAVIELQGKTTLADFMVVATGTSRRHLLTMAEKLRERLKKAGLGAVEAEGLEEASWVLLDAGDVIVHLFRAETRALYDLERLWSVAPPQRLATRAAR